MGTQLVACASCDTFSSAFLCEMQTNYIENEKFRKYRFKETMPFFDTSTFPGSTLYY